MDLNALGFNALASEARACGDDRFLATGFIPIASHQPIAECDWQKECLERASYSGLCGVPAYMFGLSAQWGLYADWSNYAVLRAPKSFIDSFEARCGGRAYLESQFRNTEEQIEWEAHDTKAAKQFIRELKTLAGWRLNEN